MELPKPAEVQNRTQSTEISNKLEVEMRNLTYFIKEYIKESDRACVILCAARIDQLLEQILTKLLLPVCSGQDELLDSERPLGTLSARIHVCYRLGLIDANFARALHLVRKLRNSFAHETSSASLDSGSHTDRVRELVDPFLRYREFNESESVLIELANKEGRDASKIRARIRFDLTVAMLIVALERSYAGIQTTNAAAAMRLIPTPWTKIS